MLLFQRHIKPFNIFKMSSVKNHVGVFMICCCIILLQSCSVSKQINKQAHRILLQDSVINTGHIGISIFEPATNSYWYNYNAEKYFVPASNVKLFTLYAGMKYLGDSLVGARYSDDWGNLYLQPAGDPTFLHPNFPKQPLLDLIQSSKGEIYIEPIPNHNKYGEGWVWHDYDKGYMPEKSLFPIYGNVVWLSSKPLISETFKMDTLIDTIINSRDIWAYVKPKYFADKVFFGEKYFLTSNRKINENKFFTDSVGDVKTIPFITNNGMTQIDILKSITKRSFRFVMRGGEIKFKILHSQPSDSVFAFMMHNSDNFFAEQTLLMASSEHLGYMNDEAIIDTLLKTDLKDVPQKPNWVDGSGLSRYNLFTPQSFVYILNKMKNEFGLERLKTILPTGGEGTLKNYYNSDSTFIYAKTGSLSNQIALSGFLITKKNKLLVFSLLTNNAMGDGWKVRRAYEQFLKGIREKY
jgi:serine-type D-Ala-D-Ala carboxypeptidase/endopeptidase (penicillin-binding protein 4)